MPKTCKVWSLEEIEFLRENYKDRGANWVADRLGRTINAVRIQACILNQSRRNLRLDALSRVEAVRRGRNIEVINRHPADPPRSPASVIVSDRIAPPSLARLMAGRA